MEFLLLGRELEVGLIMTKSRRCYAKQHLSGTGPTSPYRPGCSTVLASPGEQRWAGFD
jgi:hypothetical protein